MLRVSLICIVKSLDPIIDSRIRTSRFTGNEKIFLWESGETSVTIVQTSDWKS